jgi:hypothetical protein
MAREYSISRIAAQCHSCGQELAPGSEFVATVREGAQELEREDFCTSCWEARPKEAGNAPELLAEWRSHVPQKQEKKKLLVDDDLLVQFFKRLGDSQEPSRQCFRFVLALVLMRKKVLIYDRLEKLDDGRDAWSMHFRQGAEPATVIDPHMDADAIARVSQQLGEVMEGEL